MTALALATLAAALADIGMPAVVAGYFARKFAAAGAQIAARLHSERVR